MIARHLAVYAVVVDNLVSLSFYLPLGKTAFVAEYLCDDRYSILQLFVTDAWLVFSIDAVRHLRQE